VEAPLRYSAPARGGCFTSSVIVPVVSASAFNGKTWTATTVF
jgi:hypothetical protein